MAALMALALIAPATSSAFTTEAQMRDAAPSLFDSRYGIPVRETYIFDPGQHATISDAQFASGPLAAYYASQGFDANFLRWAPIITVNPDTLAASNAEWSFCRTSHAQGTPCPEPIDYPADFHAVRHSVTSGNVTLKIHDGGFIGAVCGNFSRIGRVGPVPTISGAKYEDLDGNGRRDGGEPGLANWRIELVHGGQVVATTTTGGDGKYSFRLDANADPRLDAGRYEVREVQQTGWEQSTTPPDPIDIPYGAGAHDYAGGDFGNYRPATIQGRKFDDTNVDGSGAGEPGLQGWTINLSGGATDVTDASGNYRFTGLRPGTYTVSETLKTGWRQTAPSGGTHTITVRSGDTKTADFGNVCLGSAAVTITNKSTGQPISGVEVRIEEIAVAGILSNDPPLPRTTTGTPMFADLLPGTYRVTAFLPAGVYTTDPDVKLVNGRFAVVKQITVGECQTTPVAIDMFTASNGKVTGGVKFAVPNGFATSGFEFMTQHGTARGTLEYQDHAQGMNLHTKQIDAIAVKGTQAWIWGRVDVGGASQQFLLHLVDNGEPGRDDRFELFVANGYESKSGPTLDGGNVQIHK